MGDLRCVWGGGVKAFFCLPSKATKNPIENEGQDVKIMVFFFFFSQRVIETAYPKRGKKPKVKGVVGSNLWGKQWEMYCKSGTLLIHGCLTDSRSKTTTSREQGRVVKEAITGSALEKPPENKQKTTQSLILPCFICMWFCYNQATPTGICQKTQTSSRIHF